MDATGEQVIVLPEFHLLDPLADRIAGWLGNLELDRPRCFLLHDGERRGTREYAPWQMSLTCIFTKSQARSLREEELQGFSADKLSFILRIASL